MLKLFSPEDTEQGSMVEDFVAFVKGGSSESITALVAKKLPTPQLMRLWGEGVRFNPAFLRRTVNCFLCFSFNTESESNFEDLTRLTESRNIYKRASQWGSQHWHQHKRQSTAGLINAKWQNKQQKDAKQKLCQLKEAILLHSQVSALVRFSSWLCLKRRLQNEFER